MERGVIDEEDGKGEMVRLEGGVGKVDGVGMKGREGIELRRRDGRGNELGEEVRIEKEG